MNAALIIEQSKSGEYSKLHQSGVFACRVKLHQHFLELGRLRLYRSSSYLIIEVMHPSESDVLRPPPSTSLRGATFHIHPVPTSPDSTTALGVP